MHKLKFGWQLSSLIIVFLLAGCLPTGTPLDNQDNQSALETIVAETLTAISDEAPAAPTETDTPIAPDVPTFTAPRALQVAYVKDGNVYIWTEGESSVGLTSTQDAVEVSISDDGLVIAYTRRDPINDFAYELWAVNTSGPTNARLLVSQAEFEALKAASPYPDARSLKPDFFEFQPGTHQLAYSTVPLFEGPGYAPGEDLRLVNTDTLEKTTVFDFGQGGIFYFSPDGTQLALSGTDHISLANADGSNLRSNVLTFPLVGTYSEYQYRPRPHWAADSGSLRVAIPPEDTLATPIPPTTLWTIPVDGSPAAQIGTIFAIPFAWPDTAFSPTLDRVGYAQSYGEPAENRREIRIASPDGAENMVYAAGIGAEFWHWTPDGTRFMYAINDGAEQGAYLGQLSGGATLIASIPSTLNQMRWVDAARFLYFQPNGNVQELRISHVGGTNHALIDSMSADIYTTYDFTQ